MLPLPHLALGLVLATPADPAPGPAPGDAGSLVQWFPAEPLMYAEVKSLGPLLRGWYDAPLHAKVMRTPAVRRLQASPAYGKLLLGLAALELATGRPPLEAYASLCGEELGVALYAGDPEPGLLWVTRTRSAEEAEEALDVLQGLGGLNPTLTPVPLDEQGLRGWSLGERVHAIAAGRWLLGATDRELLRKAARKPRPDLENSELLAQFSQRRRAGAVAFALLDGPALAAAANSARIVPERLEEPLASLLLGDLLEAAARAPWIGADLTVTESRLDLDLHLPVPPAELPEAFRVFVPAGEDALHRIEVPEGWFALHARRDVADWWRARAEFLTADSEKGFREADAQLALFFGGKSFADEVLPALEEEIVLIGGRQRFAGDAPPPEVRYPSGALLVRPRRPEELVPEVAAAFQSFLGVLGLDRAQKGLSPLLLFVEEHEGTTVRGGRFLAGGAAAADPVRRNFSPCMAQAGDWLVLSTTEELLHDLLPVLQRTEDKEPEEKEAAPRFPPETGTALRIEGAALAALLQDNRRSLLAKKLLEEDRPLEELEQELDLVLALPGNLDHLEVTARAEPSGFLVELELALCWPEDSAP